MHSFLKAVVIDVWLCCSAASDYRKRRKSEPSSSQVNAQSQNRAATSPKPVDAYRPSSSLKKPVIRSSPSSPSRAKGTHIHAFIQPPLLFTLYSFLSMFLYSLLFPRLPCVYYTYHIARKSKNICCVLLDTKSVCLGHKCPWLVLVEVWRKSIESSFFPTLFSLLILLPLPSSSTFLLGITA